MTKKTIAMRYSGPASDCLYGVPTMLALAQKNGALVELYLNPTQTHPAPAALAPLLASQEGFALVKVWQGEGYEVDLDLHRLVAGAHSGHLPCHYFYCFDCWYDLTQPWLSVAPLPGLHDRLVVNRSAHNRSDLRWDFLAEYRPLFVGHQYEFVDFKRDCPTATWLPTDDLLQLAQAIAGAKCFVGNHSAAFAMAESLKAPRILDVCPSLRNVVPQGGEARCAVNQAGFEANVKALMEKDNNSRDTGTISDGTDPR